MPRPQMLRVDLFPTRPCEEQRPKRRAESVLVKGKEIMQLRKVLLSGFLSGSTLRRESVAEPSAGVRSLVERDQRHPPPPTPGLRP